jgi:hypothetical protein
MKDENLTDLDDRRSAAGLMGAEMRRYAQDGFEEDLERRRLRDADLEAQMLAEPSETWPEAAAKAIYLLRLLAPCPEAQDARIARLVERAVIDLDWLTRRDDVDEAARRMTANHDEDEAPTAAQPNSSA